MYPKKIMICDDDEGIIDMLEIILEDTGSKVCSEINSLLLFDRLVIEQPELLILDLWMPVLAGDQVLKRIRADERTRNLQVIVISASTDGKQIALNAGADQFLSKPFDINELLSAVEGMALDSH